MAVTIGNFAAINDSEVDAESPLTESLVTRLRDNAYWVNEGTNKTTETTATKYLKPDGSGGIEWGDTSSLGVDGTKGSTALSVTPATSVAIQTDRILLVYGIGDSSAHGQMCIIDSSDDTYKGIGYNSGTTVVVTTGTLSGSNSLIMPADGSGTTDGIQVLKSGSNYDFSRTSSSESDSIVYLWL
jgi:hypothetical protein